MLSSVNLIPAGTGMKRYRKAQPVIVEMKNQYSRLTMKLIDK